MQDGGDDGIDERQRLRTKMNESFAATQVISKRTRRDRSRTSVIGLLRAIGIDGAFKEHFVDVTQFASKDEQPRGNSANFETLEVISKGPHGTVIKAFDRNVARTVAMKVLLSPTEVPEDKVLRFVHEAQLTGQLEHPNIVPVHEIGVDSNGNVYYVMKFVKGTNLRKVIEKLARGDKETIKQYPLPRLLDILNRVSDAVAFAHSRGVIHRDLKPENVMLGDFGEVLVVDWGLGKLLSEESISFGFETSDAIGTTGGLATVRNVQGDADVFSTMDGVFMGTPAYMAPEQAKHSAEIGAYSDVYALGGILYAILTLRPPIQSKKLEEIMQSKLRGAVTPPTAFNGTDELPHCPNGRVPEALSAVALRALSLKPSDRYQSVEEFREELDRYTHGEATEAEQAGTMRLAYLMFMRHRERILALAVFALLVLGVAGVATRQVVQANREAHAALLRAAGIGDAKAKSAIQKVDPAAVYLERLEEARRALDASNPAAAPIRMTTRYLESGRWELDLSNNDMLRDLTPLAGLEVESLYLANTGVSDLTPLEDLPLRRLVLAGSPVRDLAPISGMPLLELDLGGTQAKDLGATRMVPLLRLNLRNWGFKDLTALTEHPTLEAVIVPEGVDPEPLRSCPNLRYLSHEDWKQTADEFWENLGKPSGQE
jgi:serine/threonine protein kinase